MNQTEMLSAPFTSIRYSPVRAGTFGNAVVQEQQGEGGGKAGRHMLPLLLYTRFFFFKHAITQVGNFNTFLPLFPTMTSNTKALVAKHFVRVEGNRNKWKCFFEKVVFVSQRVNSGCSNLLTHIRIQHPKWIEEQAATSPTITRHTFTSTKSLTKTVRLKTRFLGPWSRS